MVAARKKAVEGVVVGESEKTKKARRKLHARMEKMQQKVTKEALKEKTQEIARWIARHASDRVSVDKDISLFDQNQNPALPSKGVLKLQEELQAKIAKKKKA